VPEQAAIPAAEMREFLQGKVARFWLPEYWCFTDQIPKTSVGKIDKRLLRDLNEAGDLDVEVLQQ
jgi:fatty-acyl-CoA synthase